MSKPKGSKRTAAKSKATIYEKLMVAMHGSLAGPVSAQFELFLVKQIFRSAELTRTDHRQGTNLMIQWSEVAGMAALSAFLTDDESFFQRCIEAIRHRKEHRPADPNGTSVAAAIFGLLSKTEGEITSGLVLKTVLKEAGPDDPAWEWDEKDVRDIARGMGITFPINAKAEQLAHHGLFEKHLWSKEKPETV